MLRSLFVAGLAVAVAGLFYKDGAPPGHTGGFGEETCRACHFDGELNDPAGRLTLNGLPGQYLADSTYQIVVSVVRPKLARAGFSLSARFTDGRSAGRLSALDSLVQLVSGDSDVRFATHTESGNQVEDDSATWMLAWHAPSDTVGVVVFNLAANAANGDDSEFGDFIYALERTTTGLAKAPADE